MKRYFVLVSTLLLAGCLTGRFAASAEAEDAGDAVSPDTLRQQAVELFRDGNRVDALARLQQARMAYEQSLTNNPDDYDVTRKLAMTLFDLGEYEASQEVFKRALVLREKHRDGKPVPAASSTAETAQATEAPSDEMHGTTATNGVIEVRPDVAATSNLTVTTSTAETAPATETPSEPMPGPTSTNGIAAQPDVAATSNLTVATSAAEPAPATETPSEPMPGPASTNGIIEVRPDVAATSNLTVTTSTAEMEQAAETPPEPMPAPVSIRGIEVQPDVLADSNPTVTAGNVSAFVARVTAMNANVVYAHGLTEPEADGSYAGAYFDTVIAPLRADILRPLAEQLHANHIALHVIMPALSLALPETDGNRSLMVMSTGLDRIRPASSWRKRISPFNTNGLALMTQLYADLATNVPLDGIVFGDDAYLTDKEDLNPAAVEKYKEALHLDRFSMDSLNGMQKAILAKLKVKQLNTWCTSLADAVRLHRPNATFSRSLYAAAILQPESVEWLAQDYQDALVQYDTIYVLADPEMEDLDFSASWLVELVQRAVLQPEGTRTTVFRLPTYSEKDEGWRSERALAKAVSRMTRAGAVHFALGPDDVLINRPRLQKVQPMFQEAP